MEWLTKLAGPAVARLLAPVLGRIVVGLAAGALAALGLTALDPEQAAECLRLSSSNVHLIPLLISSATAAA